ncbi:MAG: folate-binding protein, partial [Paracoccaceae bacterium]
PQTGIELISNESYILEMGFERLNGVSFHKGCYVGQEVTARMKHKTTLRKGLARVALSGSARTGDAILRGDAVVGTLHTISGRSALAYLRFDKAGEGMKAGDATVHWDGVLT